jgi:hypothetical protein
MSTIRVIIAYTLITTDMKAFKMTTDEIRNSEGANYNPQVWSANIDRLTKWGSDVQFYMAPKGEGYEYNRYFVEYTLPDGLRLFDSFGYSSGMSSGGFYRLDIEGVTNDGKTMKDLYNLVSEGNTEGIKALAEEITSATMFNIEYNPMYNENGEQVVIATTPTAREWMIERSTGYGMTFTKGF